MQGQMMADLNVRDVLDPGKAFERWSPGFWESGGGLIDDRAHAALQNAGVDSSAYAPNDAVEAAFRAGWAAMLQALIDGKLIKLVVAD